MNQEEIIKNNILIATKLMGMKFTPTKTILLDKTVKPQRAFKPEDLDYHKNWNSLMLVVEKVEKTHWVEIDGITTTITDHKDCNSDSIIDEKSETKITSTYNAMVQFINYKSK